MGNRTTANWQKKTTKNRPKWCQNQPKIDEKLTRNGPRRPQEQLWSDRRAKKSKKVAEQSILDAPRGRPGDPKFIEKCIKKTMKKRFLPKTIFFRNLSAFRASRRRFSSILGPKMDARTIIFWWFFETVFLHRFLVIFVVKKKKHEKWKSSFRIVKTTLSWGSPRSRNNAMRRETTFEKTSIFKLKSKENRWKNREQRHAPQKSSKNCSRARLFYQKIDFWSILGSRPAPKIDPKWLQKKSRKKS